MARALPPSRIPSFILMVHDTADLPTGSDRQLPFSIRRWPFSSTTSGTSSRLYRPNRPWNSSDLIIAATAFYTDEAQREQALRGPLTSLLHGGSEWQTPINNGTANPDAVWLEGPFTCLILGLRNESGVGGDPFLQNLVVFGKVINQKEVLSPSRSRRRPFLSLSFSKQYSDYIHRSNLPVILLTMAGNCLTVSTAVFTNAMYADKLTSLDLRYGFHADENALHVARTFTAINKCLGELRRLYRGLKHSAERLARVIFPCPTVIPPDGTVPQLEFFAKLDRATGMELEAGVMDEANERHAIYLARMPSDNSGDSSPRIVLVKFTANYNQDAHRLLANSDPPLAPALHSCTPVLGNLFMVVMDYVSDARSLHYLFSPSHPLPKNLPKTEVVRKDLSKALDLLHEQGFVFGDLRPANVFYSPTDNHAFLVDFDGVGKHQESRYSPFLNIGLGLGVSRWQVMDKEHDRANLKRIMAWFPEGLEASNPH